MITNILLLLIWLTLLALFFKDYQWFKAILKNTPYNIRKFIKRLKGG